MLGRKYSEDLKSALNNDIGLMDCDRLLQLKPLGMIFKNRITHWLHRLDLIAEPTLSGEWERFDDHFAGCRMSIGSGQPHEAGFEGRLTHVPLSMIAFGWHSMDLKCKDIRRVGVCCYSAMELFKEMDLLTGNIVSFYMPATMNLLSSDLLQIRNRSRSGIRDFHYWRRVENQEAQQLIQVDDTGRPHMR